MTECATWNMCWTTNKELSDTVCCLTRALLLMPHHCIPAGSRSLAFCMTLRANAREGTLPRRTPYLYLSPCRINKPSPLQGFEGSSQSGASSPAGAGLSMFSRAGTRRRLILGEGTQHSSVAFASSRQGSAEIQLVGRMNPCQAPLWSIS